MSGGLHRITYHNILNRTLHTCKGACQLTGAIQRELTGVVLTGHAVINSTLNLETLTIYLNPLIVYYVYLFYLFILVVFEKT